MELDDLAALATPDGAAALAAAAEVAGADPLLAASTLRARGVDPALATAALTQAVLRRRAAAKFGPAAAAMFFTRTGLEQATRGPVAERRAARLAGSGATSVADLGCGIGADTIAFARAGLRVRAVDASPVAAAVAEHNARALGLAPLVEVSTMDATALDLSGVDAVFCDPARRTSAGRRVFDPAAYSPPWDFVAGLADRVPRTLLKLAPGIDHGRLPPGAEGEWVSVDGEVVEAAFWCGPLASAPRRASVLRGSSWSELTGSGEVAAPVGPVGAFLFDPDGAVVRSHLVAEFAARVGGTLADPTIAYVHAPAPTPTPFGRCYAVLERLPIAVKRLRAALRALDVGALTILKRGSALDVERLRRDLRLSGGASATLALTRVAGDPAALLLAPGVVSGPGDQLHGMLPAVAGQGTPATTLLTRQKVVHRVHAYAHDPKAPSYGAEAAAALDVEPARCFKTLIADVEGGLTVAVVPVSGSLDLKGLAQAIGAKRAAMADPVLAERTTGYVLGGISPLGQRKRLATVVDESALAFETVYVSAGRRGLEIELAPDDLVRLTDATVAAIAAP